MVRTHYEKVYFIIRPIKRNYDFLHGIAGKSAIIEMSAAAGALGLRKS